MDAKDQALIEDHYESDEELKKLWNEHLDFERQLVKLDNKPYLSPEEKFEKKRLQLAKLAGKTRIEEILQKYRKAKAKP